MERGSKRPRPSFDDPNAHLFADPEHSDEEVRFILLGVSLVARLLAVVYFKALASKTGLAYQKLIDLYLLDCAKKRKKLTMKWVA